MAEHIIFAAIKRTDNCIIFGRDHAECIKKSPKGTCKMENRKLGFGFLTNKLRFVSRKEAARIAYEAIQIDKWEDGQMLISEELWSEAPGGKFRYDETFGYIKR